MSGVHRYDWLTHYAAYLHGKRPRDVTRKEWELARRNALLKLAPIYFDPLKTVDEKRREMAKVLEDFLISCRSNRVNLKLSWPVIRKLFDEMDESDLKFLLERRVLNQEKLCWYYQKKRKWVPPRTRQLLKRVIGPCTQNQKPKKKSKSIKKRRANVTRLAEKIASKIYTPEEVTQVKIVQIERKLKEIILTCWFTKRTRASKVECIEQKALKEFGVPLNRPYDWYWGVLADATPREIAEFVPKYMIEEYLTHPPRRLSYWLKEKLRQALSMF